MPEGNDCGQEREKPNKTGRGCRGQKIARLRERERGIGRNHPNLTSGKEPGHQESLLCKRCLPSSPYHRDRTKHVLLDPFYR